MKLTLLLRTLVHTFIPAMVLSLALTAQAQNTYPSKSINLVVPYCD